MKPLFEFVVKPVDGKNYDNMIGGLIVSTSIEDHKATQRHAEVIEVPVGYDGPVEPGDTIIVHHNVFREFYGVRGKRGQSKNHLVNDRYLVNYHDMYMYRKPDSDWNAIDPYIFISPVENDDKFYDPSSLKQLFGRVEYSPTDRLKKGDYVSFQKDCEYEFRIDDKVLYRMYVRNITLI